MTRGRRDERGFVLVVVIFFAVLLVSAIGTFLRRATVDAVIARNRDQAARAEALGRGGIRLATALILQDLVDQQRLSAPGGLETAEDTWALAQQLQIPLEDGGELRLSIRDTGAQINLNGLFAKGAAREGAEAYLTDLLEKVIAEMPGRPEEKLYEAGDLARSLIDFVDGDDVTVRGGVEDEFYQTQTPPYRVANRPLLSLEELGLVQGFDAALIEALRPYATVYPYVAEGAVNLNTAPSWVLASLHLKNGSEYELPAEQRLRDAQRVLERGQFLCPDGHDDGAGRCAAYTVELGGEVFPPPAPSSQTFLVSAEAVYGSVTRRIEAVVDRSTPQEPRILAWQVR